MKSNVKLKCSSDSDYSNFPDFNLGNSKVNPKSDWIVSYHKNGEPFSRFGDETWDLSAYRHPFGSAVVKFKLDSEVLPVECVNEIKKEAFLLLYVQSYAFYSVLYFRKLVNVLVKIAIFCNKNNIYIQDFWREPKIKIQYVLANSSQASYLLSIESALASIQSSVSGLYVVQDRYVKSRIKKIASAIKNGYEQTVPVPSLIYTDFISNLMNLLQVYIDNEDDIFAAVDLCVSDGLYGRCLLKQNEIYHEMKVPTYERSYRPEFRGVVKKHELGTCLKKFGVKITQVKSLIKLISRVQLVVKLLVHIYSGMRDGEASSLPLDCLSVEVEFDRKYYKIIGSANKQEIGLSKNNYWVTSKEAALAVEVMQRLARKIYSWSTKTKIVLDGEMLLFPTTQYISFSNEVVDIADHNNAAALDICTHREFINGLVGSISEADISELELFDPHRSFRDDERFSVGVKWALTTHQFRRSLGIFAPASGLVSLPSLKRQFNHITESMVLYYSKGCTNAKNLLATNPMHFCKEYQEAESESAALSYMVNVVDYQDKLWGGHGAWVESQRRNNPDVLFDRKQTMAKFRRGELRFTTTPLGGCASVDPCNYRAMGSILECINCKNSVIKEKSLNLVVSEYGRFLSKIEPGTAQYNLIKEDLFHLKRLALEIKEG